MTPALLTLLAVVLTRPVDAYGDPLPEGAVARLGSVRWRCPDPPDDLVWSPDGKYLLSTHGGKTILIWAYPAGVVVGRFEVPTRAAEPEAEPVEWYPPAEITQDQIRFSSDGRSAIVYAGDNQLFQVYLPDGQSEELKTTRHRGRAIAMSPDGLRLVIEVPLRRRGNDCWTEVQLINRRTGLAEHTFIRHALTEIPPDEGKKLHGLKVTVWPRLSPDGRYLTFGSLTTRDGPEQETIVDCETGRTITQARTAGLGPIFTPHKDHFLTLFGPSHASLWRIDARPGTKPTALKEVARLDSLDESWSHAGVAISGDGTRIVLMGAPSRDRNERQVREIFLLDGRTLHRLQTAELETGGPVRGAPLMRDQRRGYRAPGRLASAAFSPDGRTLAVSTEDSVRIRFVDVEFGATAHSRGGHASPVRLLRSTASGRTLISVGVDRAGRTWDVPFTQRFGTPVIGARVGRQSTPIGLVSDDDLPRSSSSAQSRIKVLYDADNRRLEGIAVDDERRIWHSALPGVPPTRFGEPTRDLPMAGHPEAEQTVVASGETVLVVDALSGVTLNTFRTGGLTATAVEFIPNTHLLAAGYDDGQILLWDLWPRDLPRRPPTDAEFDRHWADLAGDPAAAIRARVALIAYPEAAVTGLKKRLRPLPQTTEFDIDCWLAQLVHPRFAVREEATRSLARHIDVTEEQVKEMLATTKSPEVEARLKSILDTKNRPEGEAEVARLTRVVAVLERIGTPEAKELLFRVARGGGTPAVRATDALERLRDKSAAVGTKR